MGACSICGKPAGLFSKKHAECQAKYDAGWERMIALTSETVLSRKVSPYELESGLQEISQANYIPQTRLKEAIVQGWSRAVNHFLEDGALDETEEKRLMEFALVHNLDQTQLDVQGAYSRAIKGAVLREILNGVIPQRVEVIGALPFSLQKTEKLIWVFDAVKYFEDRTQRAYVGASQGVSVRIAKGVYYRTGSFRGSPVETMVTAMVGQGPLAVTNKHIYFSGGPKGLRVAHNKIVVIQPYTDGVAISGTRRPPHAKCSSRAMGGLRTTC